MFLPAKAVFLVSDFAMLAESVCCAHSFLWKIFISLDCRHSTYIFGHLILD